MLPGQAPSLQTLFSELSPAHPAPLWEGGGFVHSRVLDFVPSPHVTLHDDHGVQFVHPPSTETKKNKIKQRRVVVLFVTVSLLRKTRCRGKKPKKKTWRE